MNDREPHHHQGQLQQDGPAQRNRDSTSLVALPLVLLVQLYQVTFGPLMGGHCRFFPTCSNYAIEALRTHGALRGSWLTVRRLLRCHPLGGCGYDPVPDIRPSDNDRQERAHVRAIDM